MPKSDPLQILNASRNAALGYAKATSAGALTKLLKKAQTDLNKRVKELSGKGDQPFTQAQMQSILHQIKAITDLTKHGLLGQLLKGTDVVARNSATAAVKYMQKVEAQFKGGANVLAIRPALAMDRAVEGNQASVLRRVMSDPDHPGQPGVLQRYGDAVVGHFEDTLQTALVAGTPWDDVKAQLTAQSPFLQQAPAYWAERIVRTEFMGAHNRANHAAVSEINDQTGGNLIRILCATFDDRTGADSYAVHGQIRRMDEPFESWFGSYMTPPNRPNDREIVVPHHMEWPIPKNLMPKSEADILTCWHRNGRKGSPPPRPLMTTVPLDQIGKPTAQQPPDVQPPVPAQNVSVATPIQPRAVARPFDEQSIDKFRDRNIFIENHEFPQLQKTAREVLGSEFTESDYDSLLGTDLLGDAVKTGKIEVYNGNLKLTAHLQSETDTGTLVRTFSTTMVDGQEVPTVHHDLFDVPQNMRNAGIGAQILEHQFEQYVARGIGRIELDAAWDGQYVWPSMGFETSPKMLEQVTTEFKKWARKGGPIVSKTGKSTYDYALSDELLAASGTKSMIDNIQSVAKINSIQDLALLKINGVPVGKEFLRWRGYSEAKMISLSADLRDPAVVEKFRSYFAAKRKAREAKARPKESSDQSQA